MTAVTTKWEYSGQPFGRPNPGFGTKAWRIKHNTLAPRAAAVDASATVLGMDSLDIQAMAGNLGMYGGYNYGHWNNWSELQAWAAIHSPHAILVSITPTPVAGSRTLDIEPGDATAAEAPAFFRIGGAGHKPIFYTSAGDLQAVINALADSGISRSEYYLWSAHWIGKHICGPSVCGYPATDATQYDSNQSYDSDIFYAYVLGDTPPPPPNPYPTIQLGSTGAAVKTAQTRLNVWHTGAGTNASVTVDGNFGALTEAAVKSFQGSQKLAMDGVVGPNTWTALNKTPVDPADWYYPAPENLRVLSAGHTTVKLAWNSPSLAGHPPVDHYEVWIYDNGKLVESYPRKVPGTVLEWEGGGMEVGVAYTAHVGASGPGSTRLGKDVYASVGFTTG